MAVVKSKVKNCIPKKATQQEDFLKNYPEYDGRGVVIGIIDRGFNICMPALQKTSTGLPKIIDCFDFENDGKVDTSIIAEVDENNFIIGLSGRKIKIPFTWKNPSGKWHLGKKSYNELCCFDNNFTENENNAVKKEAEKENLKIETQDAILDCFVWFDGNKWRACVDTSFSENLENVKILTNYRDDHEFGIISDEIGFCVTIQDDGNLLEIFSLNNDHGTIVANIVAAYYPGELYPNGLAPGAQIVLIRIGKQRQIGKAFKKCIKMKVDIITISLGLKVTKSITKAVQEATQKHGIIIFKSASNDGPVHLSLEKDFSPLIYNKMFIIGSIVPHEIKLNFFGTKKDEPSTLSMICSRGPLNTGERGIDFTAPGVMISTFQYKCPSLNFGHYTGSSLASPNAAGSVACLISALKANSIPYNLKTLELALSNTAYLPNKENRLEFGNGIIQINSAFEYFKSFSQTFSTLNYAKLFFLTKLKQNGIYLVQKHSNKHPKKYFIKTNATSNNTEFSWILKTTENGKSFVEHPDAVPSNGIITVSIDPRTLKPGSINYAEIHVFQSSNICLGSLFRFPITVIITKHLITKNFIQQKIILNDEIPYNIFLHSPSKESRCTVKLTALEKMTSFICFQYAIENSTISDRQYYHFNSENNSKSFIISSKLQNQMFEISICQYNNYTVKRFEFFLDLIFE